MNLAPGFRLGLALTVRLHENIPLNWGNGAYLESGPSEPKAF